MNCDDVETSNVTERYLLGSLSAEEQEAFEVHFFECDGCFEGLEAMRALREELSEPKDLPPQSLKTVRGWWPLAAGIAASVVAVGIGLAVLLSSPDREIRLAELARVTPPVYEPARLRGTDTAAQQAFRRAMEPYIAGDYPEAIPGLEEAARLDPDAANISFFLGACYLVDGRVPAAVDALERTVDYGETPWREEALLLLAKAQISAGDVDGGTATLDRLVALEGDLASEARSLLVELQKVSN